MKPSIKAFLLFTFFPFILNAATLRGTITDKKTNETLIGASVQIKGTNLGAVTDLDGRYELKNIPNGTYTIIARYVGYQPIERNNVNIQGETILNIQMSSGGLQLDDVKVVAKKNMESESMLLLEQKKSVVSTQAVGAKEISRKGIGDAEAAVAQVSGISKQEGVKNVFVRGLGDRYNFTTLNGFPLPSEDPEYKNISLDFFESDMIQNIGVKKVFSGSDYSDAGGAIIDISSKQLVGDKELKMDFSGGLNLRTIGKNFLQMDGVNYWGVARDVQPYKSYKTNYNFGNKLDPHSVNLPINHSYGLSLGKNFHIGKNSYPLSFYMVGMYKTSYAYTQEKLYDSTTDGQIYKNLTGTKSSQNINEFVLGNLNYMPRKNEINYNFLIIHDNNQYVGEYVGKNSDLFKSNEDGSSNSNYGYLNRQQTNDNLLITNQLIAKFKLTNQISSETGFAYNYIKGNEPDRKINALVRKNDMQYLPESGDGHHIRNYEKIVENNLNLKLGINYALRKKFDGDASTVYVGYNGRFIKDDFNANQYMYYPSFKSNEEQTLENISLDNLFNQANLDSGYFQGGFLRPSTYTVTKKINSVYIMSDYQLNPKLTANISLKYDIININIDYDILDGQDKNKGQLNRNYVLPSLNLKYTMNDKHAFRLGLSKTYTLPQSKEISPYQYLGLDFNTQGNPALQPSNNYNIDVKWDFYMTPSELLSMTTFYKYIKDPIARAYLGSAGGFLTYANISDFATVAGIEAEIRKNIFNKVNTTTQRINKLSFGLNASYIYSKMNVNASGSTAPRNTQLEGSSPIIANCDLSYLYSYKNRSFTNSLVLNYYSDKIYTIGMVGFKDVIEKGVPTLNFVSISQINNHWSIKLKVKNILDPEYQLTRKTYDGKENQVLHSYHRGMDLSLGATYEF